MESPRANHPSGCLPKSHAAYPRRLGRSRHNHNRRAGCLRPMMLAAEGRVHLLLRSSGRRIWLPPTTLSLDLQRRRGAPLQSGSNGLIERFSMSGVGTIRPWRLDDGMAAHTRLIRRLPSQHVARSVCGRHLITLNRSGPSRAHRCATGVDPKPSVRSGWPLAPRDPKRPPHPSTSAHFP
jgi:hypothetical protein